MGTLLSLAEEAAESTFQVPAWVIGGAAFGVLMLLLFLVTRFDPNR